MTACSSPLGELELEAETHSDYFTRTQEVHLTAPAVWYISERPTLQNGFFYTPKIVRDFCLKTVVIT